MKILFYLLVNIFDFLIIHKYYSCFSEKKTIKKINQICVFFSCILILSLVNYLEIPILNLVVCCTTMYIYSWLFKFPKNYRLILPIIYIGFGFVAELICYFLLEATKGIFLHSMGYFISVLLCLFFRFAIVWGIEKVWNSNLPELSRGTKSLLFLIPSVSITICCIAMYIIKFSTMKVEIMLNIMIIFMVVIINFLLFRLVYNIIQIMTEKHQQESLLQEADLKEKYYREVERSNQKVREIKHNLKNMLLAISAKNNLTEISDDLNSIVENLEETDKRIYTSNVVFNTILNTKVEEAKAEGIQTKVYILIPQKLKFDYSDAGVLIGNLFDNAIEACQKIVQTKRWISISIVYRNHLLLVKICNSKDNHVDIEETSKEDKLNHGIGIPSVRKIVEKYDGIIDFTDYEDSFEVSASLYEIEIE